VSLRARDPNVPRSVLTTTVARSTVPCTLNINARTHKQMCSGNLRNQVPALVGARREPQKE
jgi:hypothetical protein